jgi:F-type H+-transporting ATPase subunit epsilon
MKLQVVTPREREVDLEVDSVSLPGTLGEMTILPGHTALVSNLEVGVLSYEVGGKPTLVAINRGFVEVLDDQITVLSETCEERSEIDVERAETARKRAQERLRKAAASGDQVDVTRAEYALRRALARLQAAGKG